MKKHPRYLADFENYGNNINHSCTSRKTLSQLKLISIYLHPTVCKEESPTLASLTTEHNSALKLNYSAAGDSLTAARGKKKNNLN